MTTAKLPNREVFPCPRCGENVFERFGTVLKANVIVDHTLPDDAELGPFQPPGAPCYDCQTKE